MTGFLGALRFLFASPWTLWVGFRYLRSKKNSRFLSLITLISVLGVGIGVAALVVVLSVMDGFEVELKKRLMAGDLHVLVTPTEQAKGFDQGFVPADSLASGDLSRFGQLVRGHPDLVAFHPVVATEAILRVGRRVAGIVLKGAGKEQLAELRRSLVESGDPRLLVEREGPENIRPAEVFVGQELAYEMGMIPGDLVTMISPIETEGPMGNIPRLKRFVVAGVYHSGLPEQELHTVFTEDAAVRSFLRRAGIVSHWEGKVREFERAPWVAEAIRKEAPPGFRVQDWLELNGRLFASLKLERFAMFTSLAFIVVVASFNIVSTLTLMVQEKRKEISILKAMGARDGHVAAIFLAEGLCIGVSGVLGGILLGFALCLTLKRYEFIQLPDIYYDRTLPVTFNPLYYAASASVALAIVLVACLHPSRRAARMNPLDGIRYG